MHSRAFQDVSQQIGMGITNFTIQRKSVNRILIPLVMFMHVRLNKTEARDRTFFYRISQSINRNFSRRGIYLTDGHI